jgi:hypothetical protein
MTSRNVIDSSHLCVVLGVALRITQNLVFKGERFECAALANRMANLQKAEKWQAKYLKIWEKQEISKKTHLSGKKGLRVAGPIRKYPFTGGAEMLQRGARRAGHTGNGTDRNETQR